MDDPASPTRHPPPAAPPEEVEPPETIAQASFLEIFGALTLATPTWTIVRHPIRFTRYLTNPGAAIHYLYAAVGVLLVTANWTGFAESGDGGDVAPELALVNRALALIGPRARLEGSDAIPVMLLFGNIVGGLTAYVICRMLARRQSSGTATTTAPIASQTFAATAYLGGASSVIFALGLIAGGGNPDALPLQVATLMLLALLYCWGVWIQRIHGLVLGRAMRWLFPFALAFASLAVFAALTTISKIALTGRIAV